MKRILKKDFLRDYKIIPTYVNAELVKKARTITPLSEILNDTMNKKFRKHYRKCVMSCYFKWYERLWYWLRGKE